MFAERKDNDPLMTLYHSNSIEELNAQFKEICEAYFIEKFALATVLKTKILLVNKNREFSTFTNYPLEWQKRYSEQKYYLSDPVFLHAQNIIGIMIN